MSDIYSHSQEHEEQHRAHEATQRQEAEAAGVEIGAEPDTTAGQAYPGTLLGDPQLKGRGNEPVRIAMMQNMQQTYGNRALQRFLQRQADKAAVPVQRWDMPYGGSSSPYPASYLPSMGTPEQDTGATPYLPPMTGAPEGGGQTPAPPRSPKTPQTPGTPDGGGHTPANPTTPETPTPPEGKALSGADWCSKFPGSRSVSDLDADFGGKVQKFINAMTAAGAPPDIIATFRPPERAFLMHWSWMISRENYDAKKVPAQEGINIEWWHGDAAKSKQAAAEMVSGYSIDTDNKIAPALSSRHTEGKAIDMSTSWTGNLKIKEADGKESTIDSAPHDGTNSDLISVGKTYGVIHLQPVGNDPNHWSTDGH